MRLLFSHQPQGSVTGNKPMVRTWLALIDSAMEDFGYFEEQRLICKASLLAFLVDFPEPGKVLSWEVRDYLYRKTELGRGTSPAKSLPVAQETLAFFYEKVLSRPALAAIARNPFSAITEGPNPEWLDTRLTAWTQPWIYATKSRGLRKTSTAYLLRNAFEAANLSRVNSSADWSTEEPPPDRAA